MPRPSPKSLGVAPQADPEPKRNVFIRSDQYSFIRRGIPSLALKVGFDKGSPEEEIAKKWLTERYHAPSDDLAQPVDKQAAGAFDVLVAKLLERVANRNDARAGRTPRSSSGSRSSTGNRRICAARVGVNSSSTSLLLVQKCRPTTDRSAQPIVTSASRASYR